MTEPNERDDLADLLAAYDGPGPRPDFVRNLRARLVSELEAARTARRRLIRLWTYVGAAAAVLLAVGLAASFLLNGTPGTTPGGGQGTAVPLGTPRQVPFTQPGPAYQCTPRAVPEGPHVEPFTLQGRPPVFVPADAENLALGKPVTSSDPWPVIGSLAMVTDGRKEGGDALVELGPGRQWIQIDLERTAEVDAIAVWHYIPALRVYHDVVVQVCDDPEFSHGVHTVFNNDYDNSSGLGPGDDMEYVDDYRGRVIEAGGVRGRYVRLWSRGNNDNDQNHYVEVEVYGRPAAEADGAGPVVELNLDLPQPRAD
jgi:hypothetical protein